MSPDGFSYLLTIIDRSSRWLEAIPLRSTTAADCATAFISSWVARFGVPTILTSDRGVQFTSALWAALCSQLGVHRSLTTAFHPQANGLVERAHRRLKEALKARLAGHNWPAHLPWVLLGLRSAPRDATGISAAELLYGAPLTLPGSFLDTAEPPPAAFADLLRSSVPAVAPLPQPADTDSGPPPQLRAANFAYVKSPPAAPSLSPAFRGPYRIVRRFKKVFILDIGGRKEPVSVDRLKPHLGAAPSPAPAPRRGRPPKSPSS